MNNLNLFISFRYRTNRNKHHNSTGLVVHDDEVGPGPVPVHAAVPPHLQRRPALLRKPEHRGNIISSIVLLHDFAT